MTDMQPLVSVIIPVYNDVVGLTRCLRALEQQSYPHDRIEIIVVDNGSTTPVELPTVSSLPTVLLHEMRPGVSSARVTGIARATGKVLAFTDADCEPEPDWIAQGVAVVSMSASIGVVGGRIALFDESDSASSVATLLSLATHLNQERFIAANWAVCANLFTTRAVMDRVGVMNPALISSGEVEWCARVRASGLQMIYASHAVVRHPARTTVRGLIQRAIRHEFAWQQLRTLAGIGRGARFWIGQHVVWPLRSVVRDLLGSSTLSAVNKLRTSILAAMLMIVRIGAWGMLRLGVRYNVRAHWG